MRTRTEGLPNRPKRVPIHEQRDKLTVSNPDPNMVRRWVNNVDDRIEKFKLAGYTPVARKDVEIGDIAVDTGQATTTSIVEKAVGGRVKAILMEIPKDLYEEDQRKKQELVDASEAAMKRDALEKSDYGTLEVARRKK